MNVRTKFLCLLVIFCFQNLVSCGGSSSTVNDRGGSENVNDGVDSVVLGDFELEGLEGEIEGGDYSFNESQLIYRVGFVENKSLANGVFDEEDCGLAVGIFSSGGEVSITSFILTYFLYENAVIYEFGSEDINVHIDYEGEGLTNTVADNIRIVFDKVAYTVGEPISGEIEYIAADGGVVVSRFEDEFYSQTTFADCETYMR